MNNRKGSNIIMANSLRAKLSKLRHDKHVTDTEYNSLIKKLDGHDVAVKTQVIDDFASRMISMMPGHKDDILRVANNMKNEISLLSNEDSDMK